MDVAAEFYKARERKRQKDAYLTSDLNKKLVPPPEKLVRRSRDKKKPKKTKHMLHSPTWMQSGFVKMPLALRWIVVSSKLFHSSSLR